ncbi:hypothetical protein GUJ93_ZPchr0004g40064 [Zizania palustris]|uniref:Inosine/uridine-preferring nucleoside hydrolase domain-containing protein n=1 Tax=Zizania palustris TaxID=103762 RepID=A0A8J5SQ40_ZIZPA|nr:hypothetical protein GUJ93_ZPchr0004g40064 [Zizania palustris]
METWTRSLQKSDASRSLSVPLTQYALVQLILEQIQKKIAAARFPEEAYSSFSHLLFWSLLSYPLVTAPFLTMFSFYVRSALLTKAYQTIAVLFEGGDPFIADFAHGSDGLGNLFLSAPTTKKVEETAAEFMVNMVSQFPGEVSVLALGPLTNVALAIKRDPSFANKVKKIVVLGVLSL